jgi:hypothetical protein
MGDRGGKLGHRGQAQGAGELERVAQRNGVKV